jgi:hypothetical protein
MRPVKITFGEMRAGGGSPDRGGAPMCGRTLSLRGWGPPTEALHHQQSDAQKDNRKHAQDNSDSDGCTVNHT